MVLALSVLEISAAVFKSALLFLLCLPSVFLLVPVGSAPRFLSRYSSKDTEAVLHNFTAK